MLIFNVDEIKIVIKSLILGSNKVPQKLLPGDLILINQKKDSLKAGQKPIRYVMEFVSIEEDLNDEIRRSFGEKKKYLIKGKNLSPIYPFNISEIKGLKRDYNRISTFVYIDKEDESIIKNLIKRNPRLKDFDNVKNTTGNWWNKQSSGSKAGILLGISCVLGLFLILGLFGMMMANVNSNTQTQATAPTTTESTPTVDNSPAPSEEDSYKKWLKDDFLKWEKSKTSSELYNLYTGAQAKKPPEKYKEFHEHYIKDYYYLYMAQKAAEGDGSTDEVGYYTDQAAAEYKKMLECMPEYEQIIYS